MWGLIANLFGGGVIGSITKALGNAHQASLNAKNTAERIEADKVISTLQARRDVLIAESRQKWNIIFRAFLALPFGIFVNKVIVYDKVLGLGSTDNLSADLWNLMMVVYGFYFVYETAALFKRSSS